jgi:predicted nucleic acid-binding protein
VYLVDTHVISEVRKGDQANPGVREFFRNAAREAIALYLSVATIREFRQGVEIIRRRGDESQAQVLQRWLQRVVKDYPHSILAFDEELAHISSRLRMALSENPLDKQIAATALGYDLTVVTRDETRYKPTGVRILNPFVQWQP